jgi:Sigma-54 interaction domain
MFSQRPFETLNCADLTRELLRSELFGHERGAFTGAVSRAAGLVSRLNGGTLFMDEIGELPPDAQAMLLRFLQEGEGRPVGAAQNITVDVRVIAATHRDLEAGVERGTFREDFYYRLWWAVLEVPPLRARREDIALLVEHFRSEVNDGDGFGLEGLIEGQIADLDVEEGRRRGRPRGPRRLDAPRRAGTGARPVLREQAELMAAVELGVLGHPAAAVEDHELAGPAPHLDRLADEGERDRIAIGVDTNQVVLGHDADQARLEPEARLAGRRDQGRLLLREALDRALMVVPWIRTSAMVTLHSVSCSCRSTSSTKVRPGRKLPLKYFTPDSTLPLVWARYGWQTRGSKLQYSAKALKVAFQTM